jgi:hypothetical protein
MANIRDLKKDINHLASEIITEAYVRKMIFDNINDDDFKKVVVDAIEFRNDLIAKVNHPDGKSDPKKVKAFFKGVRTDMKKQFSALVDSVNGLK